MKKEYILGIIILVFIFTSCAPEGKNKHLTYQNIIILSDMSSRIRNPRFPQKDTKEIHAIVQYFKNECVKPGKKIGDKSSISFSVFSEKTAAFIDMDRIKNLGDKQQFVNSTGKYIGCGLEEKLVEFEDTVKVLYERINNRGLDLISLLMEKIENEPIIKQNTFLTDGVDTTFISYENHIYVFTDGYLEYQLASKALSNQFFFGQSEIEKVRKYCVENKVDITTALEKEQSLCLEPSFSRSGENKLINLHILETHERDKDLKSQTFRHPKGLRDNEILEAVWRKWAEDSEFKSFVWRKY